MEIPEPSDNDRDRRLIEAEARRDRVFFISQKLQQWSAIEVNGIPVTMENIHSIGFFQVYDSLESLQKDHGKDARYSVGISAGK
jgi:hypothetical protein